MTSDMITLLDEVVAEVFILMLGHTYQPTEAPAAECGSCLSALIRFTGTLEGECALELDRATAGTLTRELTGADDESLWADTTGELCNMIAGTWKSRLAGERAACKLSVPQVTEGPLTRAARVFTETIERFYEGETGSLALVLSLS